MFKFKQIFFGLFFITHLSLSARLPNIVLMGPPGCGKGTFAELLKPFGYKQISIGDILRWHVEHKTAIGKLKEAAKEAGVYLDHAIVAGIIEQKISDCLNKNQPFILDNYPRRIESFNFIMALFKKKGISKKDVIFFRFNIRDQTSFDRILNRYVCMKCSRSYNLTFNPPKRNGFCDKCNNEPLKRRSSDTPENTAKRLYNYNEYVRPLGDKAELFDFELKDINVDLPLNVCLDTYKKLIMEKILRPALEKEPAQAKELKYKEIFPIAEL